MKDKKVKAIRIMIDANTGIAHKLKLTYAGKDLSALVTQVSFYLYEDNVDEVVQELISNCQLNTTWFQFDEKDYLDFLDKQLEIWQKKRKD